MRKTKTLWALLLLACAMIPAVSGFTGEALPGASAIMRDKSELSGGVDVDLTVLSSTMVYGEMYNIMTNPDAYMGKTIKMAGPYYASYYDGTGRFYHYVIVEDATACCAQGMEIVWNGDHTYPNDYPENMAAVEVVGVLGSYEELGQTYIRLAVDEIAVKQ